MRGEQWIPPGEWLSAKGQLFIWQIRLPRTPAVLLVGGAGALRAMQALFENPLASRAAGVSNGAGVGLIAAVLLGKESCPAGRSACAIFGALLITFILLRFARRHLSTSRLLLAGWRWDHLQRPDDWQSTSPPLDLRQQCTG